MATPRVAVLLIIAAVIIGTGPARAFERTAARVGDREPAGDWSAGATCSVSYYNICNGWIWVWHGWSNGDIVGLVVDPCCDAGSQMLLATNQYLWSGQNCIPSHGYTGLVSIQELEADGCPGAVLASQPFCPSDGDNVVLWNLPVSGPVVLTAEFHGPYEYVSLIWPTDHPAAGPTGPEACGVCYPADRVTHSFYFGRTTTPLCPGSPFYDGVCFAELALWSAAFACPTSVEHSSWGSIKNLYR